MKKIITLFLSLLIISFAYASTNVSGTISSNTTWNLAGSPYIVTGNLSLSAGYTLTINSGVEVKFYSGRTFDIYGNISANTVTFTSNEASPSPGNWNYLTFFDSSNSTMTDCTIEYGKYIYLTETASLTMSSGVIQKMSYYGIHNKGVLNLSNTVIDLAGYTNYGYGVLTTSTNTTNLTNVSISNCYHGIYANSSTSTIGLNSCTISNNTYPFYYNSPATVTTSGTNSFTGNTYDVFYVSFSSMSSNWTLPYTCLNVPYLFANNFTINNGYTLTISSKNIIKSYYHALIVKGKLIADAPVGENIYFTSYRDDNWGGDSNNDGTSTAPVVGNWYGIQFNDESDDASVMRRCMIKYAGNNSLGGVSLSNASPTIDYCDFSNNYYGAYFQYTSNPTFTNNTIGSSTKTPIAMSFESNPIFTNNVLSFADNQYDAIGLIGGTLTADAHIIKRDFTTVSNITYLMLNGINIPAGYTLTINPGIVIKATTYGHRIIVEGKLVADGTAAEYITLTSVKDDNYGNPGDTNKDGTLTTPAIGDVGAIIFETGSDPTSILDHFRVKYSSAGSYSYSNGGENHYINNSAIATIGASPTITNCDFRELQYGISCYALSNPTISNNTMTNITYTPFSLAASSNPTFSGNSFSNVGLSALGLIGHNIIINSTIVNRDVAGYTNISYVLLENIKIINGANLDIENGTVIKMKHNTKWTIEGGLKTIGTSAKHVIFTSIKDDNTGNPFDTNGDGNTTTPNWGDWYGLFYLENSDDSYNNLLYTDLQYGGANGYGIITTTNASPTLNQILIDKSYHYGVWIDGNSNPSISNTSITNCRIDPIAMSLTSNPVFTNISFTANGSNGIKIIEGTLSTNATLAKRSLAGFSNVPYIIGKLTVSPGSALTLEQGVIIKFRSTSYFTGAYIHGALNSTGTSSEKIIITSIKDDTAGGDTNNDGSSSTPSSGDWNGLIFYDDSDDAQNKLVYTEIRYAYGHGSYTYVPDKGSVRIDDAYVLIDHTVFQQSGTSALGIYGSSNPAITNCEFYNISYEPIHMAMFSNPSFSGNTVANIGRMAIGIQNETYSQTATIPQRDFAGYSNISYLFYGATINSGTTITIPAGTVFKSYGSSFEINGQINIVGTSTNKVVFTDYRDDDYGNPLDTEGNGNGSSPTHNSAYFDFKDVSNDASSINHTILRYSSDMIRLNSASPTITNCLFEEVNYGITCSGVCAPIIDNNTFNNLTYAPISISLISFPASLSGNQILGSTWKGIKVKNETLTQDVTLQKRSFGGVTNIPYIFYNYTIGTGVTLSIDPGVICKFQNSGSITVNNGLIAEGSSGSGNKIVFTSLSDDFYGGDTNGDGDATASNYWKWNGIQINSVALDPLTRFEHCIFRNGKSTGLIKTISASPSIQHCSFSNSYGGVYATGASSPTINYCDFDNISTYKAVNNVNPSFTIDAEDCWWGNNTGPTHSGNPGGTGEEVSDGVDYSPYGTSGAINPILGDASLNGLVQAYDASLVLQHVVGTITLNATQQEVADVTGAAGVSALDASYILQYTVGLINSFPATLLAPIFIPTDVELTIGNKDVSLNEEFSLPISISNVENLYAMEMTISYDPEVLIALNVENMIPEMNLNFKIDQENGMVKIAFAGIESIESAIDAANLIFQVNESITMATTTEVKAATFVGNETDLSDNVNNGTVTIGDLVGFDPITSNTNSFSCYPNPFSNQLKINYSNIGENKNVSIRIYDTYGRMVDEIATRTHSENSYEIVWDGKSMSGEILPNGIYSVQIIAGDFVSTQKVLIVR